MIYLRLVVGPFVICDVDLFSRTRPTEDEPPPQLNGGSGSLIYPDPVDEPHFGFT